MKKIDYYNVAFIRKAFVNAIVPTTRLIITHLELLLYGATINQTNKDDTSIVLHVKSPIWRKEEQFSKDFKFILQKRENNYKILDVVEL